MWYFTLTEQMHLEYKNMVIMFYRIISHSCHTEQYWSSDWRGTTVSEGIWGREQIKVNWLQRQYTEQIVPLASGRKCRLYIPATVGFTGGFSLAVWDYVITTHSIPFGLLYQNPPTRWLINNRNLFPQSEVGSLCPQSWVRALFPVVDLSLFPHMGKESGGSVRSFVRRAH